MTEVTIDGVLLEEYNVLNHLKTKFSPNPKKFLKVVQNLRPSVPLFIQRGLIDGLLTDPDPIAYFKRALAQLEEYPTIIAGLIRNGAHGMIVQNNVVHPIALETNPKWLKADDKWALDQEVEIQHALLKKWMEENEQDKFHGLVVMFSAFGFTGVPREISVASTSAIDTLMTRLK